ncbi:single strand DNA binding protein [Burkholderia phage Mica]|uniref:Single-stranded DNA-binding protein n=1 Tax=Burkholderia phage Mica TaxID=2767579 RepID=A0A873WKP9_9CAUD|nr:single strand DNA binding protein [Burkholderia phage Mica]QPB08645.1 ssDNA binding protein [Burkholderia phage Mica]
MLNKVQIIGRLGGDPEVRYLPSGDAVANFSVATTETWKDKQSGEKKEATEWHRVAAFGKLGEICGEYLRKGGLVYIEGSIRTQKYEKDGETRYSVQIRADNMKMLGGKPDGDSGGGERRERPASNGGGQQRKPAGGGFDEMDDDIPF